MGGPRDLDDGRLSVLVRRLLHWEILMRRRVLIVGGVAGGASCAARLRRLDDTAE
jgi:hypothetical protein